MAVIENLKNFIRHGKQARLAQQQPPPDPQLHHFSDPAPPVATINAEVRHDFSVNAFANKNLVAQAEATAAHAVAQHQNHDQDSRRGGATKQSTKTYDEQTLAKIVAQEKATREKMPRYPGLDRYSLQEKMGDGAFSNVYRARDLQGVHGEVAIKVVRKYELSAAQGDNHLHPNVKKGNKVVERSNILKEVSIMRKLDHPHIVRLIDFKEERAYYYLILELCPGGELFHQIVRLTYFSEELSRHVIVQVAQALKYLHEEKGVVHRDIKPENLLFYPVPFVPSRNPNLKMPDEEDKVDEGEFVEGVGAGGIGQIKIADFGLSKVIWEDTTVTPCGTVGYTAPEIVKDERYSKSVDMWALGCVLYTLLCGFPPFYDESISVLTEKVAKGQYTFLSPWWDSISKSAQDLISHLLTVDPEKRYTIEEFMQHPWIRNSSEPTFSADDAPPLATPAGASEQFPFLAEPEESPGLPLNSMAGSGRKMDFRSPGVVSLREVFDVGYAVHRMEEEGKRRKHWKQGYRGSNKMVLNEEDEAGMSDDSDDEMPVKLHRDGAADDVGTVEQKLRGTNLNPSQTKNGSAYVAQVASARGAPPKKAVPAAAKTGGGKRRMGGGVSGGGFELSLDNATLLGRRRRAEGEAVAG